MKSTVSLSQVDKSFSEGGKTRTVLRALDFEAKRGETVAFVGASGSGKSTILNIVSGLTTPDRGSVIVDSLQLDRMSETERTLFRRKHLGFVFQFFHLIDTLTVEENLRLPLQLNQTDNEEGRQFARSLLEKVGLADRANSLPDRLSGGEQQRVAVCRALVHQPPLILADEPTGNLDDKTAEKILAQIFCLCSEFNTTLLMVTHSEKVAACCDRRLRLQDGKLIESTSDVHAH